MERDQAGQEKTLVEVRLEMDSLEVAHRPKGSPVDCRGYFKCAFALGVVLGLVIVALVVAVILYFFMFTPSRNQEAPPLSDTAKVITSKLKKSDQKAKYDIFTVDKTGTYLIYGWVKLAHITGEKITLMMWRDEKEEGSPDERTIENKDANKAEIFFFQRVQLAEGTRISIYFSSTYTDSLFHAYEL